MQWREWLKSSIFLDYSKVPYIDGDKELHNIICRKYRRPWHLKLLWSIKKFNSISTTEWTHLLIAWDHFTYLHRIQPTYRFDTNLNGTRAWQKWVTIKHKFLFHFDFFLSLWWFFICMDSLYFWGIIFIDLSLNFSDFPNVLKLPSNDLRMNFTWNLKFHTQMTEWPSDRFQNLFLAGISRSKQ